MTPLLTVRQAAERLNYSEKTILRMVHSGRLEYVKFEGSREYRFKPQVIDALVESSGTATGALYCPQVSQVVPKRAPLKRSRRPIMKPGFEANPVQTKRVIG